MVYDSFSSLNEIKLKKPEKFSCNAIVVTQNEVKLKWGRDALRQPFISINGLKSVLFDSLLASWGEGGWMGGKPPFPMSQKLLDVWPWNGLKTIG